MDESGATLFKPDEQPAGDGECHLGRRWVEPPFAVRLHGDARAIPLPDLTADLVITSPPYWRKRDYGDPRQIGQEATSDAYVENLLNCMHEWKRILPPWGSIFINIGDTYSRGSLAGT